MTEKEKEIQAALGTMKRQMTIGVNWRAADSVFKELKKALHNFGLFVYDNGQSIHDHTKCFIIISNEKLTNEELVDKARFLNGQSPVKIYKSPYKWGWPWR